jgi:uncharacterized protein YjbI with pentapeptide repeats
MRPRLDTPAGPSLPNELDQLRLLQFDSESAFTEARIEGSFVGQSAHSVEISQSRLNRSAFTAGQLHLLRLTDVVLDSCDFSGADLEESTLTRVQWRGCRMSGLAIARSSLRDVVFSECRLDDASLRSCDLERVTFEHTDLSSADFSGSTLQMVRLFDCNLSGADFSSVKAKGTRFHGSVLTDLKGAGDLRGVVIDSSQLLPLGVRVLDALGVVVDDEREPPEPSRRPTRGGTIR